MARWVWYKPDHKEFGQFMRSDQMRDVTEEVAQDIAPAAAERSPVGEGEGPHMADQFRVRRNAGFLKVSGNVRVRVDVYNSDPAAAPNEFGGRRNQRHRMLGRAGAAFGDFKGKEPGS